MKIKPSASSIDRRNRLKNPWLSIWHATDIYSSMELPEQARAPRCARSSEAWQGPVPPTRCMCTPSISEPGASSLYALSSTAAMLYEETTSKESSVSSPCSTVSSSGAGRYRGPVLPLAWWWSWTDSPPLVPLAPSIAT
jgi:hypothetical protein